MNILMMLIVLTMNIVYASTYLYLLQYLSSVSRNFLSTAILYPWLNLSLGILFFWSNCEWNFFLSFPDYSLLVYKNATDLWIFILYLANLLNSFISSNSFLVASLGFLTYSIISCTNNDSFTHFSPMGVLLFLLVWSVCLLFLYYVEEECWKQTSLFCGFWVWC